MKFSIKVLLVLTAIVAIAALFWPVRNTSVHDRQAAAVNRVIVEHLNQKGLPISSLVTSPRYPFPDFHFLLGRKVSDFTEMFEVATLVDPIEVKLEIETAKSKYPDYQDSGYFHWIINHPNPNGAYKFYKIYTRRSDIIGGPDILIDYLDICTFNGVITDYNTFSLCDY